jgi:hypothetical protein
MMSSLRAMSAWLEASVPILRSRAGKLPMVFHSVGCSSIRGGTMGGMDRNFRCFSSPSASLNAFRVDLGKSLILSRLFPGIRSRHGFPLIWVP